MPDGASLYDSAQARMFPWTESTCQKFDATVLPQFSDRAKSQAVSNCLYGPMK